MAYQIDGCCGDNSITKIGVTFYPRCTFTKTTCFGLYQCTGYEICNKANIYNKVTNISGQNCSSAGVVASQCGSSNTVCGKICNKTQSHKLINLDCKNGGANVEMSVISNFKQKKEIVLEGIDTIKNTINSNIINKELFVTTSHEQYKNYFQKLSGSALTTSQQKLLLEQISDDFIKNNALNLYMNVQNILSKDSVPIIREQIKEAINTTMKDVLPNIITSYNYGGDFLQMNYANAYQTMYYATSLQLYKFKWNIIAHIVKYVKGELNTN